MANATHPVQDGRFIVSPARSRSRDVSPSINSTTNNNNSNSNNIAGTTVNGTNGDGYRDQSPSRRFSLANVLVPTMSRLSYLQATEEEHYSLNNSRSSSIDKRSSTLKMTGNGIASTHIDRSDIEHEDNNEYDSHNSITNESSSSPKNFIHSEKPPMILSNFKTSNKTILHQRDPSPNLGIAHRSTKSLNNQYISNNTTTNYASRINSQQEDPISTIKRIPILSARSEEAMRKHQVKYYHYVYILIIYKYYI